jgi:hypothetical protein
MKDLQFNSVETIPNLNASAAFQVDSGKVFKEDTDIVPVIVDDKLSYMPWGGDNAMPFNILELIESDETLSTCQMFNAEVCYGSGLNYNTDECSASVKADVHDFALDNALPLYFLGVCQDFKHFAFCVSVIILNADGTKIVRLLRKEACYCRLSPADKDGAIRQVLYANWRNAVSSREDIEVIELLDINSPWRDLAIRMGRIAGDDGRTAIRTACRKFAVLTRVPTPDSTYYPIPYYASLFKGKWYNIKQLIGMAKEAKLKNIAPIKYQIEISNKYWDSIFKSEGITDRHQQQKRIVREKQQILDFLTGVENAGKVWFSTFYVAPTGEVQHEVVINKIDNDKEGGDWSTDIQEAVNMFCFTMRVHSNLVGSVPGKSQTNNSGSDKRELYTIAQALQKPYHDLLFTVHQMIIRFNNWSGCKVDVPFIQLTLLSEHQDAKEVTINPNSNDTTNNQ